MSTSYYTKSTFYLVGIYGINLPPNSFKHHCIC